MLLRDPVGLQDRRLLDLGKPGREAHRAGCEKPRQGRPLGLDAGQGSTFLFHPSGDRHRRKRSAPLAKGPRCGLVNCEDAVEALQSRAHETRIPAVAFAQEGRGLAVHDQHRDRAFGRLMHERGAKLAPGKDRDFGAPVVKEGPRLDWCIGGWFGWTSTPSLATSAAGEVTSTGTPSSSTSRRAKACIGLTRASPGACSHTSLPLGLAARAGASACSRRWPRL